MTQFLFSGVETDPLGAAETSHEALAPGHTLLIQAVLRDQTDGHAELLQENQWLIHPNEHEISLRGNAFVLENTLDGSGVAYLKIAPLPEARACKSDWDLCVRGGTQLQLQREDNYEWARIPYQNGKWGRIAAVHRFQRARRPYDSARDGLFLTNTWGDRGRDAHLNSQFMAREIVAATRLGADVVQIDDGWQRGVTQNSASAVSRGGGAWNGFWDADPNFWSVNRARFPDGLEPLIAQARAANLRFGLWFAPDSSRQSANWERDANAILGLHRELGIEFFKIDALKLESPLGEANLRRFFAKVARDSRGAVTFDLDITAEQRFGYFGLMESGPLFVENRYTDWGRYYPHHTLRVLWQLAHWVDPIRLRLEWLNVARNVDKYPVSDPLAPAHWSPDALFATVMMAAPLGWFEVQNLPANYFEKAAPLIQIWKKHREALANGTLLPIGHAPDGAAWTGFVSLNAERSGGYALVFRELNRAAEWTFSVPLLEKRAGNLEILGGQGAARWKDGMLSVEIPESLGFVWMKLS